MRGTAVWIAIHDAPLTNGTLHLIPGSRAEYGVESLPALGIGKVERVSGALDRGCGATKSR